MGWNADLAIQAQNLVAQIETRLQANGWSQYDASSKVYTSTNNQGVVQYLQVSQVGSYTYIQFQGWRLWNNSTHTGTNGSSTSFARMYLGGAPISATTTVDLYSSVTANRAIFLINAVTTNFRSFMYAGGLDSLAGTNDPGCYLLVSSFETSNSLVFGQILDSPSGSSAYWGACFFASTWYVGRTQDTALNSYSAIIVQGIAADSNKIVIFPILVISQFAYNTGYNAGFGVPMMRGNMDGLLWCPLGNSAAGGTLSHLDAVTIGGTTYLVWQPGGQTSSHLIPWTGNYQQGIAISET